MLSDNEKKSLIEKLRDQNKEIFDIRKSLNSLNEQKEDEFKKRETVTKQISERIQRIKELKDSRNTATALVKEHKTKREELRARLLALITDYKKMEGEKDSLMQKHKLKQSPEEIRRAIKKLETKIETDAVAFDTEQRMMKKIKEFKKQLDEGGVLDGVMDKRREVSAQIRQVKREIEDWHSKIQESAKESQEKHEEMMKLIGELDALRAEENEHKEKFLTFKGQFTEANRKLKDTLPVLNEVKTQLDSDTAENRKQRRDKIDQQLKEKEVEVEEKIKRGEKLTTRDLLIFQRSDTEK